MITTIYIKAKELFLENYWKWILEIPKRLMIAYISYTILTNLTKVNLVIDFWAKSQRYYLASYVSILLVVGLVFYEGIGFIIELGLNNWIKNNRTKEKNLKDKRALSEILKYSLGVVRFLSKDILNELDQFDAKDVLSNHNLKKTIQIIKGVLGFAVLGFVSEIIYWKSQPAYFFIGAWILISLIFLSTIILIAFYVIIDNLDHLTAYIREYNSKMKRLKQK